MEKYRARVQTASRSKTVKTASHRPSSEEAKKSQQRKLAAQKRREEKRRLALLRKRRRQQIFRLSFALSLLFLILYWSVVAILIGTRDTSAKDALPLMVFTQGERKPDEEYEKSEFLVGGVKYLPVTKLSPYFTASQFGDSMTRSIQLKNGQWATFYLGTCEAVINFVHTSLSAPALLMEDELYLPLDFYSEKMNCFELKRDDATHEADTLTVLPVEPAFRFGDMPSSPTVLKNTIPEESAEN